MIKKTSTINALIFVVIGNAMLALGYAVFAIPVNLIVGGATGIGLIIEHFTGFDYATVVLIINIVMLVVGYMSLGKKFAAGTLLSSILFPLFLKYFELIHINVQDEFLCTIYAGICVGIGLGLVFRAGYSSGGMDVPTLIINKKTGLSISTIINVMDTFILLLQVFFSSYEGILYGIITVFVSNFVLDQITIIGEKNIQLFIISHKYELIAKTIMEEINRGCTFVNIQTGHLRHDIKAVLCVVNSRQYFRLNEIVLSIDHEAFIITNEIHSVRGRGFTLEDVDIDISKHKSEV